VARPYLTHARVNQAGFFALSLLNRLEFGGPGNAVGREKWRLPSDYRKRRNDPAFREAMVVAIHKWNAQMKNGR
jgi:hypothetical protein